MPDKDVIIRSAGNVLDQAKADYIMPDVNHARATLQKIINNLPVPQPISREISAIGSQIIGNVSLPTLKKAFNMPKSLPVIDSQKLQISAGAGADPELYKSTLGTPVYASIEFLEGKYETNQPGVFKTFGPLKYEAILINVHQPKRIVKTEIQGRNGSVKEYIGDDDYHITITGIITAPNGQSPASGIIDLKKMLDAPIPIQVACTYLQNLGIFNLVVEDYELGQQAGGYSYQTFSIQFLSDQPQELRLTNV